MPGCLSAQISVAERCQNCPARNSGLCRELSPADRTRLAGHSFPSQFERGQPILLQGEQATRFGIIASGMVKIVMVNEDGDEHVIQLLRQGEIVGQPVADEAAFSWQAVTDVELCQMAIATFPAVAVEIPAVAQGCLRALARQLENSRMTGAMMRSRNAMERVALWLCEQTTGPDGADTPQYRITLSRRELASLLDMTTETLCRVLKQLDRQAAIRLLEPDLVAVPEPRKLRRAARLHSKSPPVARRDTPARQATPATRLAIVGNRGDNPA